MDALPSLAHLAAVVDRGRALRESTPPAHTHNLLRPSTMGDTTERWTRPRVILLAIVPACFMAAIAASIISSLLSMSSPNVVRVTPLREAFTVETDPLAITDLRVVEAATDDAARDKCIALSNTSLTAQWIIAGRNLNSATTASASSPTISASDKAYVYLCMQQQRLASVLNASISSPSATNGSSLPVVLQSLRVIHAANCSAPLVQVFSPRNNVVLCAQTIDAQSALATGMYLSDVTATFEPNNYNVVAGWTAEAISVTVSSSTVLPSTVNPVYISYKRPARPISAIRVVSVRSSNISSASHICGAQFDNQWEQAGYTGIQDAGSINETILCVERPLLTNLSVAPTMALNSTSVLVDVAVVESGSDCEVGFTDRQNLTASVVLCGKFQSRANSTSYIAELRLEYLTETLTTPGVHPTLGKYTNHVVPINISGTGTHVMLRIQRHTGIVVSNPHAKPADASSSSPLHAPIEEAKSRLVLRTLTPPLGATIPQGLSFKIVQLADLHFTGDASHECRNPPQEMIDAGKICTEADTTAFVEKVLDAETPDFVVFSGDNIEVLKGKSLSKAIEAMLGPVEARKIPYAVVLGNHDDENGQSRANIAQRIIGRQYSHMQWGPRSIAGVGNYEVSVMAPSDGPWGRKGSKVFPMYFLDSLGYPSAATYPDVKSTYDWIKPDQIAYYKEMASANRNATLTASSTNQSSVLPAVMFFHIPIPEYASVGSAKFRSGDKNEKVETSEIQSNLFSALVEMGDVKATFVGHDHVNEYCYKRQSIQLCYGGGTGFAQAYGSAQFARRSRVIEWSVDGGNRRRIKSWKRHYGSVFDTRQHEEVLYEEPLGGETL